jgi:hypothetical protein
MYLPDDKWSPRYEQQFYTLEMKTYSNINKPPSTDDTFTQESCNFLCGEPKFPAVYYSIEISCGTAKHTCLRRYSQFQSLCNKFDPTGKLGIRAKLPPKRPFHEATDEFLGMRMKGLYSFLNEVLTRQEAVGNPLVVQFLELDVFRQV